MVPNAVVPLLFSGYLPYETQQATLHLAAAYGDVREMQTLLRQFQTQNKNVDERTKDGMTPLLLAAQNGHLGEDSNDDSSSSSDNNKSNRYDKTYNKNAKNDKHDDKKHQRNYYGKNNDKNINRNILHNKITTSSTTIAATTIMTPEGQPKQPWH